MLLVDVNVLVDAMREDTPDHRVVHDWFVAALVGSEPIGIPELALSGLLRLTTNHRVFEQPSSPTEVLEFIDDVFDAPAALRIRPGERHFGLFRELVDVTRSRANDVPDAYFAAMAIEVGAGWVTRDAGFRRFPGLRVVDPS